MPPTFDLKDMTRSEIEDFVVSQGLSSYRAKQIFAWLYRRGISDFQQMTDIAKDLRHSLAEQCYFSNLTPSVREVSRDGTIKYGFKLDDGHMIESVMIPEQDRNTLCVSAQVGCAMGCRFCLTATMGFIRNLTPAEIVNQVYAVNEDIVAMGKERINNLVFMGMGEPLANFNNLIKALNILMDEQGLNFSERRTTVSTCGLAAKIIELGNEVKVNLAISLHGANDKVRSQLMPVNDTYPLDVLLDACRKFPLAKRKRIMMEYILIDGVNDSEKDARELAAILQDIPCKINLLPCNEAPGQPYHQPPAARVERFQDIVRQAGYTVLLRSSRGADISAACGQLATRNQVK